MSTNSITRSGRLRSRYALQLPALLLGALSFAPACAFQGGEEGEDVEGVDSVSEALTAVTSASDLAFHWAPRHIQDIDKSYATGKADYITRANYDGDFISNNNWDNLMAFNTPSFAYYAMAESTTHFFLYYMFFHPRDWASSAGKEHENDSEGALIFVRKDGSQFGKFEGLVTQAHGGFYLYRDPSAAISAQSGKTVYVINSSGGRPMTYQQSEGHGFYGCGTHITNCVRADDGINYMPSLTTAGIPPAVIPNGTQVTVPYRLIDMMQPGELFSRRNDVNTFTSGMIFTYNDSGGCGGSYIDSKICDGSAGAIWGWTPPFSTDPAAFLRQNFNFGSLTAPSSTYIRNDFNNGHDVCQTGSPLVNTGSCVTKVCGADPFCCSSGWDEICVAETASFCGLSCVAASHNVCLEGEPLPRGATHCTNEVCAVDSFCCDNAWDEICVAEANSVCGLCQ